MAFSGVLQASIAWPDCEPQRYIVDDFERFGIEEVLPPAMAEAMAELEADGVTVEADGTLVPGPGVDIVPDGDGGAVVVDAPSNDTPEAPKPFPPAGSDGQPELNAFTEAQAIRNYLADHGTGVTNKEVIAALREQGIKVESSQVTAIKKEMTAEPVE